MTSARALFTARRIVVVGASRDPRKMGGRLMANMRRWAGDAEVEVVHPTAGEISGFACVASVDELTERPDLGIVAVPALQVEDQVRRLATAGCSAVVVFASGYAEGGDREGKEQQAALARLGTDLGLTILGPNSNGMLSLNSGICATSNPGARFGLQPGSTAVVGQSGALALGSVLAQGARCGLRFSHAVATGNEALVTAWDVAVALHEDAETSAIGMVIEGWRGVGAYLEFKQQSRVRKPIVVLKIGRTVAGGKAALSHTAQIQSTPTIDRGLLRQTGATVTTSLPSFYAALRGASGGGGDAGGVAVVSTSGGAAGLAADLASERGLTLVDFEPRTVERLRSLLPEFGMVSNPLDVTSVGVGDPALYAEALRSVHEDGNVAAVLAVLTVSDDFSNVIERLLTVAPKAEHRLVIAVLGGSVEPVQWDRLAQAGMVVTHSLDEAIDYIAGQQATDQRLAKAGADGVDG